MGRKRKKRSKVLSFVFIAIIILAVVTPALLTNKFGYGFSPILTGSMQPTANPGDVFLTQLYRAVDLQPGDVITINNQTTGIYYSHRIVEVRDFNGAIRIITKGDANNSVDRDPYITSRYAKVSKVIETIPLIGRPMTYMNTVQGRQTATSFLVIANIFGLIAFLFRRKVVHSRISERVYKELYEDSHKDNEDYRKLIDELQGSPVIEQQVPTRIGSNS